MRHISNTLTKSALWLLLAVGSAPAWANDCPDPLVAYTLVLDGKDSEYAAQTGDFPTGKLSVLANHLVKAFPFIHEAYPAALKKFQHSSGVKRSQISPMASMS